jgi:L-lactate dehydrogenase (cytochrome)
LPKLVFDFVDGATGREAGAQKNAMAFDQIESSPRVMVPTESRNLATEILGQTFSCPFGITPMGMCNLIWPEADAMLARAATARNIPLCVSSAASTSLEEMRAMAGTNVWFQLYVQGAADGAFAMAERASKAGYEVLVLTVDVPQVSRRVRDLRNGFTVPFRLGPRQILDFATHPHWTLATLRHGAPAPQNYQGSTGFDRNASRAGADWAFLHRLRDAWRGTLVVKGVMSAEDAVRIRNAGADAVWVSNHGGRQLDAAPPAISVLPHIREAVGADFPLIFDSGIRQGEDVVRALALGADFVMLGRPVLYAIGAEGETGLTAYLDALRDEIDIALAQLGLSGVDQIDRAVVAGTGETLPDAVPTGLKLAVPS